ncbi:MAG: fibrobacter succinogenes major paralogous domain-containing protein [Bacteroidota bacterium]|nr:fibrobacter succinogenes major paralogous domain-containing protein [Bacteroidota bacterium]
MTIRVKFLVIIAISILIFSYGCKKDKQLPGVTTSDVDEIKATSAITGGNILSDGGEDVTSHGVCWGIEKSPTIENNKTIDGAGIGNFTSNLTALNTSTTYYLRAYATNKVGTAYGNEISFTTLCDCPSTITDIDGNIYGVVKIGSQCWMTENLRVTRYQNYDLIPDVKDTVQWSEMQTAAYSVYGNDPSNIVKYGYLYNGHAATNFSNIAPAGWRVSSDTDWTILVNYLGGENIAGLKLKAGNESGFNALFGGSRICCPGTYGGHFYNFDVAGYWWTNSISQSGLIYRNIKALETYVYRYPNYFSSGYSIRCVKDCI